MTPGGNAPKSTVQIPEQFLQTHDVQITVGPGGKHPDLIYTIGREDLHCNIHQWKDGYLMFQACTSMFSAYGEILNVRCQSLQTYQPPLPDALIVEFTNGTDSIEVAIGEIDGDLVMAEL